ncbi:MAG TPA: 4Fe-4S ferredoxin [Acidimicrobiales bacterium]|nr:4Fe-4S ferredoxin [Acidimicrobiales bacterium]
MAKTEANPPLPRFADDYVLQLVDADYLAAAVKPKQFINIDQEECITCEGCVDICPWKCIWLLRPDVIDSAENVDLPGIDPADKSVFIIDDDVCTRCALCVDRCPTGVITLGKVTNNPPPIGDIHGRTNNHGYAYGMRF